ncbi:Spc7-domain-containing protein [Westerdykella ornata]|uniref:Spc7-domain-containing protein n=1 Tax=Westerdykella ornata TaxID=318751 RepID=A0A6A6JDK5_WESOR|nr:Spc7-domain-containing protein [Westerdykella ornata]KAF2273716.1 Spc7-domain-containing protein [Westerdykella ornata]
MASDAGKENIADGLVAYPALGKAPSLSPRKSSRRMRSKSIGPGGLAAVEEPLLKETNGNRRKSAFIPAVKSILASNDEDEKKRRRKSLARRRVSFAPEATLHTWDVVEYLRDATTSSASSEASRRASNISEASTHASNTLRFQEDEEASTPPRKSESNALRPTSTPANQRDVHQKKNRRSSGIPPMNFNNPDDIYSSSPLSGNGSSPYRGEGSCGQDEEEDEGTLKLDSSRESNGSAESNARLNAALREAAGRAGTQNLNLDGKDKGASDDEDMSMELAEDDVTAAFKPWAKNSTVDSSNDQEAPDPFAAATPGPEDEGNEEDEEDDMSMDITRAIGRIVQQAESPSSDLEDMSMELTMPLGCIKSMKAQEHGQRRKSLKRRASLFEQSQGSPAKRPASRRTSLRQRRLSDEKSLAGDDATMDFTVAIGSIKTGPIQKGEQLQARRNSVDTTFADETMDFTVAIGSIKGTHETKSGMGVNDASDDEDMSMEFTNVIGGIKNFDKAAASKLGSTHDQKLTPPGSNSTPSSASRGLQSPVASNRSQQLTPKKSPAHRHDGLTTPPKIPPPSEQIEKFEPSPFVRKGRSSALPQESVSTPTKGPQRTSPAKLLDDPIAAPILERRRSSLSSVQFSPLAPVREEPLVKSTAVLSNNIKLLSTPRKQSLSSPTKRMITPKKSLTPQKSATPQGQVRSAKEATPRRSLSPRKKVAFGYESPATENVEADADAETQEDVERISLQEFLEMTKIRFMDLSTTKRRHTAAPSAFHDKEIEEKEESLDRYVVAAACTLPEYELYQHACHEMKKYISDGRHFVRTMEANVMEENPLLFREYLTAPPNERAVMDNQFKNLKTNARLEARGEWYSWRSTLLRDLKAGLLGTMEGFMRDESVLAEQEKLLDSVVPSLVEKHGKLETRCKMLQQRHDELNSCDREELEQVRERLVAIDTEVAEKRQLLAELQQEFADKEARIEAAKERKIECMAEIRAAERVREECRGWTTTEVRELKGITLILLFHHAYLTQMTERVTALERVHGWSITAATSSSITMTHLNDLELYFHPSAFNTGNPNAPNASISLGYVGDSATPHPRPLTTGKRFFLQLIRAHLHCIPQAQTRISDLLALVKNSWATALAVAEGVRWLSHDFFTEETILSDERMAVTANMLLPTLQTKVRCSFEISVVLGVGERGRGVETRVVPSAELVYGEKYKVDRMREFLEEKCADRVLLGAGAEGVRCWAEAVLDLKSRLRATGRKGERA